MPTFLLVDDLDGTLRDLAAQDVEPEKPPTAPAAAPRAIASPSCATPDGYRIELIGE